MTEEPTEQSPEEAPEPVPAQPVRARRRPWPRGLVGLAGLVVGALTVGSAWLVSGPNSVDRRPITAPPHIGVYVPIDQAKLDPSVRPDMLDHLRQSNERSSELLSASHGGAGALVELYSDEDVRQQLTVMIYRAPSPHPLYTPYEDASAVGLAKPAQSVEEYGNVSCLVSNDATPAGQTPSPNSAHTARCTRTNSLLTVEIQPNGDLLGDNPAKVAKLVDDAWNSVV